MRQHTSYSMWPVPLTKGRTGGNIENFPISIPGGSFAFPIVIIGASGSPTIQSEGWDRRTGFILRKRDPLPVKGLTDKTSTRIQRFRNFNLFTSKILIHLGFGNSVERGGFCVNRLPCLIAGRHNLLWGGRDDLGR